MKDFERQGNRWLERTRELILAAHQAKNIALGENFDEKQNFLKKVGSNPQLAERAVSVSFRNDWQILAKFNAERRSREATIQSYPKWLAEKDPDVPHELTALQGLIRFVNFSTTLKAV